MDGCRDGYRDNSFSPEETEKYYYAVKAVLIAGEISRPSTIKEGFIYNTIITFLDNNFEDAVRTTLSKWKGNIYIGDVIRLTFLEASSRNITSLSGIEHFVSLKTLVLFENKLSDLSPLSSLTSLTSLNLEKNNIYDISTLVRNESFGAGDFINIDGNPLSDEVIDVQIRALGDRGVIINGGNPVKKAIVFPDPGLEDAVRGALEKPDGYLYTDDAARVTTLNGGNRNITDLRGIENLLSLQSLSLGDNNISDLSPLASLKALRELDLTNNNISDIRVLVNNNAFGAGDSVSLGGNPLSTDVIGEQIPALLSRKTRVFGVEAFRLITFPDPGLERAVRTAISKSTGDIYAGDVADLTSLSGSSHNITDLRGIENFVSLKFLYLQDNNISDITAFSSLTNLSSLHLDNNSISDITPLSSLTDLIHLYLRNNNINDLSALVNNEKLAGYGWIFLSGNPLSKDAKEVQIPALTSYGANVFE